MSHNRNLAQDTFEQLVELGQSTAKKSVEAVVEVLNPFSSLEQSPEYSELEKQQEALKKQGAGHTPLNFDKLNDSYKNQDLSAIAQQRKFLNRVKGDEEKAFFDSKQKEEERKRLQAFEEAERKATEHQKTIEAPAEAHGKAEAVFGRARPKAIVDITPEAKPSKTKG